MLINDTRAEPVEITDSLTMIQCNECHYMAGPGYNSHLDINNRDQKDTVVNFEYHDCKSEKADAEWYYVDA